MKLTKILITAAVLLSAGPALAETSGSISFGTDYMSRGTSQTFGEPGIMAYVDHQFDSGFYIAGFAARVDFDDDTFDDGTDLEADLFVGHRGNLGAFNYDAGVSVITYHGTKPIPEINPSGNWDMVEAKISLSRTIEGVDLGGTVAVTPDYFNNYGPSVWLEATAGTAVTDKIYASGGVGRQQFFEDSTTGFPPGFSNYYTWNLGAAYSLTPTLSLDIRYHDNDTNFDLGPIYKPRVVATLRKDF